jgi:hypothetical protein
MNGKRKHNPYNQARYPRWGIKGEYDRNEKEGQQAAG